MPVYLPFSCQAKWVNATFVWSKGGEGNYMSPKKKPEPKSFLDDDDWQEKFSALSDDEQLARARQCRFGLASLIAEGADFDIQLLADLDGYIDKFEKAIGAEKKATAAAKRATDQMNRSADALLALLPENDRISFFVPPKPPDKNRGN